MSKKKNGLALFEVMTNRRDEPSETPAAPEAKTPPAQTPPEAAPSVSTTPASAPTPSVRPKWAEPAAQVDGSRLRLSLSYGHCIATGVVLVALLIGAFFIGRQTASPGGGITAPNGQSGAEQPGLGNAPHRPDVAGNPGNNGAPLPKPTWVEGKYYLIIQRLGWGLTPAKLADARDIATWCTKHGETAGVLKMSHSDGRQQYIVLSCVPFDKAVDEASRQQRLKHAAVVEQLGDKYPGNYNFMQRVSKNAPLDPRFIEYKEQ